ncbi:MAG TPA: sigma-70 family RNA polymerase sigma factor [Azospirillaceae bacterium]|nr:sigma-70 family RNA polymerase sigma factor [Azospirillaceae bacterium]
MSTSTHDGTTRAAMVAARREPMLEAEEETDLFRRWRDQGDGRALDRLVRSHMRLAVKVAGRYARSGLDSADLVAEAFQGLVLGVRNFDPDRGTRLGSYVLWWIRAAVQEYARRNLTPVKAGNSKGLRRAFFNLGRAKRALGVTASPMQDRDAAAIAAVLGVTPSQVREVEALGSLVAVPLDAPGGRDGSGPSLAETLADDAEPADERLAREDEERRRRQSLTAALATLDPREREILAARRLREVPEKLATLSVRHGVSAERVRQLENRAVQKLRRIMAAPARMPSQPALA